MDVVVIARHPGGGIKTYFRYIFGTPVMLDLNVSLITPFSNSTDFFQNSFKVRAFRHEECHESVPSLVRTIWRRIARGEPGLVHSHGFTAGLLAAIPSKVFGVPHILTTHDVFFPEQFNGYRGRFKKRVIQSLLSCIDILNPVGADACDNLRATFPGLEERTRFHPIRNGIDSVAFSGDEVRRVRAETGVADDVILLGFFGRFMGQKGFSLLRDAVASLNTNTQGYRFEVACFGWGGFIREEQAFLKEQGIDHFFHFLPGTDEMASALRGVDAVVMPSRWEACPLLPMEAMVSGTTVIASDCIGMKEVTENSPALTFPSGDLEELKGRLMHFATNIDQLSEQARTFRKEAAARFDASDTARALRRLYDGLMERGRIE